MVPGNFNLSILVGDSIDYETTFTDRDTGVPINITGATIEAIGTTSAGTTAFAFSTTNGKLVIADGVGGKFLWDVSSADTGVLTPGTRGRWALKARMPDGSVDTYLQGEFVVHRE